ncbi:hypothetical protein DENSPDRAFT_450964 [Dentipellis sp. KUC8613]|nr:hypothetical protein DENSPDRAFT_450964 [Dentipellis sp. KUC8613]
MCIPAEHSNPTKNEVYAYICIRFQNRHHIYTSVGSAHACMCGCVVYLLSMYRVRPRYRLCAVYVCTRPRGSRRHYTILYGVPRGDVADYVCMCKCGMDDNECCRWVF